MPDRFLIGVKDGVHGLYVSKPGFDVKTCAAKDLSFDSRLGHYGSVLVSGTTTFGQTVTFPTCSYVPLGYAYVIDGNNYAGFISLNNNTDTGNNTGLQYTRRGVLVPGFRITTNSMIFYGDGYVPAAGQSTSLTIRYIVWRCFGA